MPTTCFLKYLKCLNLCSTDTERTALGETTKGVQLCQEFTRQPIDTFKAGAWCMPVKIYHNPRCSKSRQTLALIQERDIEPDIIDYLHHPPSKRQLKKILAQLGMKPRDLIRKSEPQYKQNHLDNPSLTDDQLIDAMIQHPILIERPIVVSGDKAVLGRPPEAALEILSD